MIGKLGRVQSREDARTLRLSSYLAERAYQAPPFARDWTKPVTYRLNDRLGCCTISALAHGVDIAAQHHGDPITITDADVERLYRKVSGYDGTPSTDRGAQMIDALIAAKKEGWIDGFVRVNLDDIIEVIAAINLFEFVYVGARLPRRILSQGTTWTLPPLAERTADDRPDSLGGHAWIWTGFDRTWLKGLPWITEVYQSYAHASLYVDEGWATIPRGWVRGDRPAPNGFDLAKLVDDLRAIG